MKLADFKNKKILVMGLGLHGGGVGAAEFFARLGSRVTVTDLKSKKELAPSLEALRRWKGIIYHLGKHHAADFKHHDYIIKNPGVADDSPFLKIARRAEVPILSDVEVFFRACPADIIGVTGTKGKSTATWFLGELLKGTKKRVWVGGNIRKSVLEILPRVKKDDWVVLELSSFQLDALKGRNLAPHIAVITNIFPDHLNRYRNFSAYAASKAGIFRFQKKTDYLFINASDNRLKRLAKNAPSHVVYFDPQQAVKKFSLESPRLPKYHEPSIAAAVVVAKHLGVGEKRIRAVLQTFRGLPGRMEFVAKISGVEFVNDTTATNPTAAEAAVKTVKKRLGLKRRLHVIAGGYDKGLPIKDFVRALATKAATVVLLPGSATPRIKGFLSRHLNTVQYLSGALYEARSMAEAVRLAYSRARRGDAVLLSPGAASFGLFRHEFDRGDKFVKAVKSLRTIRK